MQSAEVGIGEFSRLDADPAIDGPDAISADDDRTQMELGDLRQVVGQAGNP